MSFKKHNWMTYGHSNGGIIEITMRDVGGEKLDFFRCNNKEDFKKIVKLLGDKYGYDLGD